MNAHIEWIDEPVVGLGATAQSPTQYADCNIAAPSETGKGIIRRLQALLQNAIPNSGVLQTGYLDAETCAAWRDYTATRPWMRQYPGNFNITNILDTLDGASVDPDTNRIVHHWRCNGPQITPDCTKVPARVTADPCPAGQRKDPTSGLCVEVPCAPGERREVASGACVPIVCPDGQTFNNTTNKCEPISTPKVSGKKKSNLGLLLLAGATVAAGYFALT